VAEFDNCRVLLVDKKISTARDVVGILEAAVRGSFPLLIMAEDIEQEALATMVVNKLRGTLKVRTALLLSALVGPGGYPGGPLPVTVTDRQQAPQHLEGPTRSACPPLIRPFVGLVISERSSARHSGCQQAPTDL
jgi:hypothetical protein